ncbi:uncharacterized protein DSM5745_00730 [Aspergillus mulundensis]|uniref:BAH domain-containing protein n=1 Tax=Aspergillus mulundensis TaxID=1810919 RepID=A0A3D8T5W7_9EURO|nr:hypothetical protein DSM5745_00730 [Aspergillus mulundensis]RDW93408.1 hypothetical protein DSM5745_00730 [Aspergillus mulundensis]
MENSAISASSIRSASESTSDSSSSVREEVTERSSPTLAQASRFNAAVSSTDYATNKERATAPPIKNEPRSHPSKVDLEAEAEQVLYLPPKRYTGGHRLRPVPKEQDNQNYPAWENLEKVTKANLDADSGWWTLQLYDVVLVCIRGEATPTRLAKVVDMRKLQDGRFMVIYAWLYEEEDIKKEFTTDDGGMEEEYANNLKQAWDQNPGPVKYMLSSNQTVALWDTAYERLAQEDVDTKLSKTHVYKTTDTRTVAPERHIYSINDKHKSPKWLIQLLHETPALDAFPSAGST